MQTPGKIIIVLIASGLGNCVSIKNSQQAELLPTSLQVSGRYVINNNNHLELISSAAHFAFSFTGQKCQLFVTLPNAGSHNYIQYELDDVIKKE